ASSAPAAKKLGLEANLARRSRRSTDRAVVRSRAWTICDARGLNTVIDLKTETPVSLSQAARLLPPGRRGRPVTLSCVLRWVLDGVRLPSGDTVRLEAIRLGGRWLTSVEAMERFALSQTPRLDSPTPVIRTPRQRLRAAERATRELKRVGI